MNKIKIMKNGIPSQHYYFLLEWKDANIEEFTLRFSNRGLCELSTNELKALYKELKINDDE